MASGGPPGGFPAGGPPGGIPPEMMGPPPPDHFFIPGPAMPAVINNLIFTSLAVIIVSLRLITRGVIVKNVGIDDYLIAGAAVRFPACCGVLLSAIVWSLENLVAGLLAWHQVCRH